MYTSNKRRQRGLTLVELVLFIVIVGIAVAGILSVMSYTTRHSADPLRRKQALMIAEALLEEVELAKFTYCDPNSDNADTANSVADCNVPEVFGPQPGSPGRPFFNVNDYAGATLLDASGRLTDINGAPLGLAGYAANLTITPEALGDIPGGVEANPDVLRITVVVTFDAGQSVRLDGYRTRYAPQLQ